MGKVHKDLKCIASVVNFYINSDDEDSESVGLPINLDASHSLQSLGSCLRRNNYNGSSEFIEHVSKEYLNESAPWKITPREFFSNEELVLDYAIRVIPIIIARTSEMIKVK